MKRAYIIGLLLLQCLTVTFLFSQSHPVPLINSSARVASSSAVSAVGASQADPKAQAKILDQYGKLPLSFEANHGQADGQVKFVSRTGNFTLFLTGDEAVLALRASRTQSKFPVETRLAASPAEAKSNPIPGRATGAVLRMKLRNANAAAKITGTDELAGTSNYFIGNDPTKWRANVPTYAKVKYEGIYSGIDLVYYGNQRQLEYDFIVAPGADPRRIAFDVSGAKRIRRDAHGDLVLKMATGEDEIRWHKPVVYQERDGARQEVAARYAITDTNRVRFELASYDASRPLFVDPLIYSTYLGGAQTDGGYSIAADSAGNAYVTGFTSSSTFPTMNPLQPTLNGTGDAFVAKLNPKGSALVYSTYLGGGGNDWGRGIAVDSAGNAYVTGTTGSTNFPTMNPLQATNAGGATGFDSFVTKLNPTGSALVYSTYLGGSGDDGGFGIALDSTGNAYVTGHTQSTDFPTVNPFQTIGGGFVSKINAAGSALVYSTYISGGGFGIAVDGAGQAYVADGALLKINASGSGLLYSFTLAGGTTVGIAVDSAGNAYATGSTHSTSFPTTAGAFQRVCNGGSRCDIDGDAFVSKLDPAGSALVYSTYLGGRGDDSGTGIAVDSAGDAYVTGRTCASDFPTMNPLQPNYGGGIIQCGDAFVTKFNPSGSALVYSSYLGGKSPEIGSGIALDNAANVYVTGSTESTNFPVRLPLQRTCGGGMSNCRFGDAFVTKIDVRLVTTSTITSTPNPSTHGQPVTFTATVTSMSGAPPDGETVTFKKGTTVLGTGTLTGGSASFTTSTLPMGTSYIKAVYGGDSNFAGSMSKVVKQVVN